MTSMAPAPATPDQVTFRWDEAASAWVDPATSRAANDAQMREIVEICRIFKEGPEPIEVTVAWIDGYWCVHGDDQPAVRTEDGTRYWYARGAPHRGGDLPAIEYPDGQLRWQVDGHTHRDRGPAIVSADGNSISWFWRGHPWTNEMKELFAKLRLGGQLLQRGAMDRDGRLAYRIVALNGDRVAEGWVRAAGWFDWIQENAARYLPELAAANRAVAMRQALESKSGERPAARARGNKAVV